MARCDVCGAEYAHAFTVQTDRGSGVFDSFDCAIHALAPRCTHCGCTVIGHGVGRDGQVYCCAHCAGLQEQAA